MKSFTFYLKLAILSICFHSLSVSKVIAYCYPTYNGGTGNCFYSAQMSSIAIGSTKLTGISCVNNGVDTSYLTTKATLFLGKSYPVKFTSAYNEKYAVWIDYNDDNNFDSSSEFVFTTFTLTTSYTGTINIPITKKPGTHRMRIRSGLNGGFSSTPAFKGANACGKTYDYGSMVDIMVTLIKPKSFDIDVTSLGTLQSDCGLNKLPISLNFTNNGLDSLKKGDTLFFGYVINSSSVQYDTLVLSTDLAPAATSTFSFKVLGDFSTVGNYDIYGFAFNKKDSISQNDSSYTFVRHRQLVNTFPWVENFDKSLSLPLDWENAKWDGNVDWTMNSGGTPTPNTGPDFDHTTGSSNYIYVEDGTGANPVEADSVILLTPCMDLSGLNHPTLEFYVHDEDTTTNINKFYIDIVKNGKLYKNIYNNPKGILKSGNWWKRYTIDLTAYKGSSVKIRFNVDCKNGTNSNDIAIDDVKIYNDFYNDAAAVSVLTPVGGQCGDSFTKVMVQVKNNGKLPITKLPVYIKFKSFFSTYTLTDTIKRTISAGNTDTFTFTSKINTFNGAGYDVTFATVYGDSASYNDTLRTKIGVASSIIAPAPKHFISTTNCFKGSDKLYVDSVTGYNIFWYDSRTSTKIIASGDTFKTPILTSTKTYYAALSSAEQYNTAIKDKSQGTNGGDYPRANWNQGGVNAGLVFDAFKDFTIDSISVFAGGSGYVRVNLSDSNGKLIKKDSFYVTGSSSSPVSRVYLGMTIPKGKTYLLTAEGSTVSGLYRYSISSSSYPVTAGSIMQIKDNTFHYFGNNGAQYRYYFFFNLKITGPGCTSPRVAVDAIIKRGVPGAGYTKGSPFNGNIGNGLVNDTISSADTSVFIVNNPTGLTSADFSSKWNLTNFKITSFKGASYSDYLKADPTSSANGYIKLYPKNSWGDSLLKMTLTYTGTGLCDTIITRLIYIIPKPVASFAATTSCAFSPTKFTNNSTINKGTILSNWDFGDGSSVKGVLNPTHTYKTGGNYHVKMTAISSGGSTDTTSLNIVVYNQPIAKFGTNPVCSGLNTVFVDSSTIASGTISSYSFDFGDKSTSSATSPGTKHLYSSAGTYLASLITTSDKGCTDTISKTVLVNPTPIVNFTSKVACANDSLSFTNKSTISSGIMSYQWKFGDGASDTSKNSKHVFSVGGGFNTTLVVKSDKGCLDSTTNTTIVNYAPNVKFGNGITCLNTATQFSDSTTLVAGPSITSRSWDFGDGNSSTAINPKYVYTSKGKYNVVLKETTNQGCSSSFSKSILIDSLKLTILSKDTVCQNQSVAFTGYTGSLSSFVEWNVDNQFNVGNKVNFTLNNAGNISARARCSYNGCKDSTQKIIKVNPLPKTTFTFTKSAGTWTFNPNEVGGKSYNWNFGLTGANSTDQNPTYRYKDSGTYQIKLAVTSSLGCTNLDSTTLVVSSTDGIESFNDLNSGVQIYPNPAKFELNIISNISFKSIIITNLDGKVMLNNSSEGKTAKINVSTLSNGVYIIQLANAKGIISTQKFIKN